MPHLVKNGKVEGKIPFAGTSQVKKEGCFPLPEGQLPECEKKPYGLPMAIALNHMSI
jgi:hypothetical protein